MTSTAEALSVCAVCAASGIPRRVLGVLDQCPHCDFVYAGEVEPDQLVSIYDDRYFSGAEYPDYLGQQDALRRSMRRHLEQMRRTLPLRGSLLEVGCAYGLFLDEARAHFDRVVGVDICEGPVAYARDRLGLDARLTDLANADFGGEQFDAIVMWDTIEHVARPDAVLARAAALLRPSGALFMTTGDLGSLVARLRGGRWRQIHPPSHVNYFSRQTISRLLERLGLRVTRVETAGYYHTLYNVLASLRLRGGLAGRAAALPLQVFGERIFRRIGLWIDLSDIMFVEARPLGMDRP